MGKRTDEKIDELVKQFIESQERDYREVKVTDNLLTDEAFYELVNTMRKRAAAKKQSVDLRDFINFDFGSAERNLGANPHPAHRRLILQLCVSCMVTGKY